MPPARPPRMVLAMRHALSEIDRRQLTMIQIGTIADVDHAAARVRVAVGKRTTAWLPMPGFVGQNFRAWLPACVGMQVLLSCPGGDTAQAIITGILYSPARPAPAAQGDVDLVQWDDGTLAAYDSAAQVLTIDTPGKVVIRSAQTITIEAAGDIAIQAAGDLRLSAGGTMHLDAAQISALGG